METNTITQIAALKDSIAENIETYRKYQRDLDADMNVGQFGNESEYSVNSLIGGVKNILTDISYLTKAHNIFIKLSTFSERNNIKSQLNNLNSYIVNRNNTQIANSLDVLKVSLRGFNLRSDKDRYLEFSNEVDTLRKNALSLETVIATIKDKISDSEKVFNEITDVKGKYDEVFEELDSVKTALTSTVERFTQKFEDFKVLAVSAEQNEAIIAQKLESVKEEELVFNDFIAKIGVREKQLELQERKTEIYSKDLGKYTEEHNKKLEEAQTLIDKAYLALQYCTAEGISSAFQIQHEKANKTSVKILWLIAAGIFIILTVGLGIWIITSTGTEQSSDNKIYNLIGRLSMMPFTLLGALFCANQYTKQKNIAEDYAYKTVLSKSIVAFSEELREKDPERYAEYISTVLREIHQDPLRRRGKDKDEVTIKDSTGLIGKVLELIQSSNKG